jgi:hypothetical protein
MGSEYLCQQMELKPIDLHGGDNNDDIELQRLAQ